MFAIKEKIAARTKCDKIADFFCWHSISLWNFPISLQNFWNLWIRTIVFFTLNFQHLEFRIQFFFSIYMSQNFEKKKVSFNFTLLQGVAKRTRRERIFKVRQKYVEHPNLHLLRSWIHVSMMFKNALDSDLDQRPKFKLSKLLFRGITMYH